MQNSSFYTMLLQLVVAENDIILQEMRIPPPPMYSSGRFYQKTSISFKDSTFKSFSALTRSKNSKMKFSNIRKKNTRKNLFIKKYMLSS